jgi:hypothetical protein
MMNIYTCIHSLYVKCNKSFMVALSHYIQITYLHVNMTQARSCHLSNISFNQSKVLKIIIKSVTSLLRSVLTKGISKYTLSP